jgi:hypothetical protein
LDLRCIVLSPVCGTIPACHSPWYWVYYRGKGERLVDTRPTYEELENRFHCLEKQVVEQKRSAAAFQEAREFLKRVAGGMFEALMVIDRNFVIQEVNERFLEKHNRTRSDVIGNACWEIAHGLISPCFHSGRPCPAKEVMETAQPTRTTHFYADQPGGGERAEEVFAFPLLGKTGDVEHVVEVCYGAYEKGRASREHIEEERLEGVIEMAGAVCLELNQPLQALSFHCERLQKAISKENLLYDQIDWIVKKIDKMSEILGKLQHIAVYATREHVEGTKIVDIDRASRPS